LAPGRRPRENIGVRWRSLFLVASLAAGSLGALACLTEPPSQTYGNPNSLQRANFEGGSEAVTCGGGDGGGTVKTDGGGAPTFAANIYPLVNTQWRCGDKAGCHGGGQAPPIDTTDPTKALASLNAIKVNGVPYIAADGGSMLCNLQGACGSPMPKQTVQVPAKDPTPDDLCLVQAWLAGGAK
jgi:hypothetical protein